MMVVREENRKKETANRKNQKSGKRRWKMLAEECLW